MVTFVYAFLLPVLGLQHMASCSMFHGRLGVLIAHYAGTASQWLNRFVPPVGGTPGYCISYMKCEKKPPKTNAAKKKNQTVFSALLPKSMTRARQQIWTIKTSRFGRWIYRSLSTTLRAVRWMYPKPNLPLEREIPINKPYIVGIYRLKSSPRIPRLNTS